MLVEARSFEMGSPESESGRDEADEGSVSVMLTRPYLMMAREVTQGDWRRVMGARSLRENQQPRWQAKEEFGSARAAIGRRLPVEGVAFHDMAEFANRMSARDGLQPAYRLVEVEHWEQPRVEYVVGASGYRLPTEAEWANAARCGSTEPWGRPVSQVREACSLANVGDQSFRAESRFGCSDGYPGLAPVGTFPANACGLYDMLGNAAERVDEAYSEEMPGGTDPVNRAGSRTVYRTSGYRATPEFGRVASRSWVDGPARMAGIGFRLVRDVDTAED